MTTFRYGHKAMDTAFAVSIVASGDDEPLAATAAARCFERIDALERLLTRFDDASDVAVIRALAPGRVATLAPETIALLGVCARVSAATAGAYDPTVERRNFAALTIDSENNRVAVRETVALDFGGIGKGFALDACAEILRGEQFGFDTWLLDAGTSTVLVSGQAWPLGVGGRWKARTRRETVLRLSEGALSGSGFEIQGAHIRDVRRGGRAARWEQSWAVAPSGAVADALTTALLSMTDAEIRAACDALGARAMVARRQPAWADRLRDPLATFGSDGGRSRTVVL